MKEKIRIVLIPIIALFLLCSFSASVQADSDIVDLELGGEGAISWKFAEIAPGDSGTKTVILHNAGKTDGVVTIWISDIEETDSAEDGAWLDDYVMFDVSCKELSTNLGLPATIHEFPSDASGQPNYLKIKRLGRGETVTLIWQWNFLSEAGNEAQGDSFSFTISYLLEGIPAQTGPAAGAFSQEHICITYLSGKINEEGVVTETVIVESCDGRFRLIIEEGSTVLTNEGEPLSWIIMREKTEKPPSPPEDADVISLFYEFKPDGATFEPPGTLEYYYRTGEIPGNVIEKDLAIAFWDATTSKWVEFKCTVDTTNQIVTTKLAHFTTFAVFGHEVGSAISPAVISQPSEPLRPIPPETEPSPIPEPAKQATPEPAEKIHLSLRERLIISGAILISLAAYLVRSRRAKKGGDFS